VILLVTDGLQNLRQNLPVAKPVIINENISWSMLGLVLLLHGLLGLTLLDTEQPPQPISITPTISARLITETPAPVVPLIELESLLVAQASESASELMAEPQEPAIEPVPDPKPRQEKSQQTQQPAVQGADALTEFATVEASFSADYLRNPAPEYPRMSRQRKEEGEVYLRVLVSAEGTAKQVQLRDSSGYSALDKAAQDAVARWRFVPATRAGQPVDGWVVVPIRFRLQ